MRYFTPVGNRQTVPFGGWWDATGWGKNTAPVYVSSQGSYHTGADLNLSSGDAGSPVYASAIGTVVYTGEQTGWQGIMVIVKHSDGMWTRYAHLRNIKVQVNQSVTPLNQLGEVTDYTPLNSAAGDHLHFDISSKDLGKYPGDWPKMDLARLERDYRDPKQWLIDHQKEDSPVPPTPPANTMQYWTPNTLDGTRVRLYPDLTADNVAGVIEFGKRIEGTKSVDGKWIEMKITPEVMKVGDIQLKLSALKTFKGFAAAQYMAEVVIDPTPHPVPPITSAIGYHEALPALPFNKRVGVHVLERIEEAREAFNLGCRSFTFLGNIAGAREMRAKGCAVIVRNYMPMGQLWSVDDFIIRFGINANDSFVVMGLNEADNISTSDLDKRFAWEREFALKMHALSPKSFIVIGGFSMGTPQIDNPDVAKKFRETYGAFLNQNASWCGLDYHSYQRRHSDKLPPFTEKVEDPAWWPKRFLLWGYNSQYCGLNSNVVMVSDEAGVDIGGVGGFPACGYNDTYFAGWYELHKAWFENTTQVYTQNIFQFSPRPDWAGYNARCVLGGLTKVWGG